MGQVTKANMDDVVDYHAPRGDQLTKLIAVRTAERTMINAILENTEPCDDQQVAISWVRAGAMRANAAIILDGKI